MADFEEIQDDRGKTISYRTRYKGRKLLSIPQLNKGRAFTEEERKTFDLNGIDEKRSVKRKSNCLIYN